MICLKNWNPDAVFGTGLIASNLVFPSLRDIEQAMLIGTLSFERSLGTRVTWKSQQL